MTIYLDHGILLPDFIRNFPCYLIHDAFSLQRRRHVSTLHIARFPTRRRSRSPLNSLRAPSVALDDDEEFMHCSSYTLRWVIKEARCDEHPVSQSTCNHQKLRRRRRTWSQTWRPAIGALRTRPRCLPLPSNACQSRLPVSAEGNGKHVDDHRRRVKRKGIGGRSEEVSATFLFPSILFHLVSVPFLRYVNRKWHRGQFWRITFANQKLSHCGRRALYKHCGTTLSAFSD